MAIKVTGTILGLATGDQLSPYTQITINVNGPAGQQQVALLTQSANDLAALSIGQSVPFYIATTPAEITAIEGVVTAVSIDSQT